MLQEISNRIFSVKKINLEDTILVVGSPRSGTTWLMNILTSLPDYTNVFEPLNPIWYPESFEAGFRSRTYLKPDAEWQEGKEYLRKIFSGEQVNVTVRENLLFDIFYGFSIKKTMKHFLANKLVVKSINMNRLLPWIVKSFNLKSVIYIIRHPCASIASQLKAGLFGYRPDTPPYYDILPTKKGVLRDASEIVGSDSTILEKLKNIETKEEILAASWCLDNYIPLNHSKPYPWTTVFYEKLISEGKEEMKRIFESICENEIPRAAFRRFKKPNLVVLWDDRKIIKNTSRQLSKWKENLSKDQIKRILNVVSCFEIYFYSENIEPIYEKVM